MIATRTHAQTYGPSMHEVSSSHSLLLLLLQTATIQAKKSFFPLQPWFKVARLELRVWLSL
jgi:hypothetical protein